MRGVSNPRLTLNSTNYFLVVPIPVEVPQPKYRTVLARAVPQHRRSYRVHGTTGQTPHAVDDGGDGAFSELRLALNHVGFSGIGML